MQKNTCNPHRNIRAFLVLLCMVGFGVLLGLNSRYERNANTELRNVRICSDDSAINITWDSPYYGICSKIHIAIIDGNELVEEKELSSLRHFYSFKTGTHGKLYDVIVEAYYDDGSFGEAYRAQRLFLNYDKLPSLPIMTIETEEGQDPTYSEAVKEDNALCGATIVNNEYLEGMMGLSGNGLRNLSSDIKIKVRGNTSVVYQDKKSYKIKLPIAMDLLGNESYMLKEWVLLNVGTDLKTYIGDYLGILCGMEWQPQMIFVNVILNGDWKGCYILTEAVGVEAARANVSESGYIFENDAYWWNAEGEYFKTLNQNYLMGYTFKYPKMENAFDERIYKMQVYMQDFEDCILTGDSTYGTYIDESSFASWILVRDLLGQGDGGGTNMYLYKYDYDDGNPISSKVKMGPLWDFDSAFVNIDTWSDCRSEIVFYFPELFEQPSFSGIYKKKWEEISPYLSDNIDSLLDGMYDIKGKDLEMSWQLDADRWSRDIFPLSEQIGQAKEWFARRIEWMNRELGME